MPNHELRDYIDAARKAGQTNEEIMQKLIGVGWQVHEVADTLLDRMTHIGSMLPTPVPGGGFWEEAKQVPQHIISVRGVSKYYGKVHALEDANLEVKKGTVTALLGPNGAGKTTLVRTMTTLLKPDKGTITIDGLDVVNDAQELRSIIGLAGQYAAVDEILSGRENLEMVGRLYHLSSKESKARASELLKEFDLEDAADRPLKTYSGGMRRRLDLAASIVLKPKVLFLDEPTTGLDPRSRFTMWKVIRDLVRGGTTLLLTTQYLEEADQLADTIYVINHGQIIARGTPDELKRQVGGDILEIRATTHSDAIRVGEVIKALGDEEPKADNDTGVVTMAVSGGAAVLVTALRDLDAMNIAISDIMLRRPSLDDVFMKLTGHGAEEK
ncbi:MAG TPA: ATP-binding cassette domain-containing protein [Candidatus Paceibacterota bacterium]|nr:ATP-binding cassette domain-containing protein [Candidatus Paceibacterota bacterium]